MVAQAPKRSGPAGALRRLYERTLLPAFSAKVAEQPMQALHETAAAPSFEHKFLFARCHEPRIIDYLGNILAEDPAFSAGRISSIYYDTPRLDLYQEKRGSDYLKTKIRLRWYAAPRSFPEGELIGGYLEVKAKTGGTRQKTRHPLHVPAAALRRKNLAAPELYAVGEMLPSLGYTFQGPVVPTLLVQYERRRYVDPFTGARVAVDTEICCPAVNQQFVPAIPPAFLDMCVLEIKGPQRELPDWLAPVRHHVRRDAFSKYAACFEHLLQPAGRRE